MPTFEDDLKTHLAADSGITAVVADRVYPMKLPNAVTLPAVTYQEISDEPQTALDGTDGKLIRFRMQINCWAASYTAAKTLAELVRIRLQTGAATFKAIPLPSGQDVYEENTKRFGFYRDFAFWYRST